MRDEWMDRRVPVDAFGRFVNSGRVGSSKAPEAGGELLDLLAAGEPPAFASDSDDRIIFWNRGAERILGRPAAQALGRKCFEVVGGRDVFGNRFCQENCVVATMTRKGEPVQALEMAVEGSGRPQNVCVTIFQIPGARPELRTIVHVLQRVDETSRLARALERVGARVPGAATIQLATKRPADAPASAPLTEREREILRCVASGLQNKEIAQKCGISLATVRNHIHNILEKLDVHSKLEAVSLSFRSGWV
jgi:DNA-binding CsgD family transcriptional regulator